MKSINGSPHVQSRCRAVNTAIITPTNQTWTIAALNSTTWNDGGHYDTVNYRWRPPPGPILLMADAEASSSNSSGIGICLFKNGGGITPQYYDRTGVGGQYGQMHYALDYANGADYYQLGVYRWGAGTYAANAAHLYGLSLTTDRLPALRVNGIRKPRARFFARNASNHTPANNAIWGKVPIDLVSINDGSHYDSLNYRWRPPLGPIVLVAQVQANVTNTNGIGIVIYKNGSGDTPQFCNRIGGGFNVGMATALIDHASGGDYYELWAQRWDGGYFSASDIRFEGMAL